MRPARTARRLLGHIGRHGDTKAEVAREYLPRDIWAPRQGIVATRYDTLPERG